MDVTHVHRFLAIVLLGLSGAGAFAAAEAPDFPKLSFTDRTLDNGLRVIALEDRATPTVAVQVWYRVGSKDDPPGRSGFAHLFEHLMFKNTERMPPETLDRLTEDVGGENNAFTADDMTAYFETVPSNHLERLLWAEAERMASLTVDEANFRTERDVVKEEFRQSVLAPPYGEFGEWIIKQSFARHPYKRPTIGNIEELDAASLEEVRRFHSTYYRPDNAVLAVAGDFDPSELQRWVDQYFGPVPKPPGSVPRVAVTEPPRPGERTVTTTGEKAPLPALGVTFLGPPAVDPQAPALRVLEQILSGGESSRLYRSLVYEKELAQSVDFSADLRADLGLLVFQMVLASGVEVAAARTALMNQIDRVREEAVTDEELSIAKNQILARELAGLETVAGRAMALGEAAAVRGDPSLVNSDLPKIAAVTATEVREAARAWLKNPVVLEYLPSPRAKDKEADQ